MIRRPSALVPTVRTAAMLGTAGTVCGCGGVQSVLAPEGAEAERVWVLFWVLTIGAFLILAVVIVLTALAITKRPAWLGGNALIVVGGIIFPIVTLSGLLAYGLTLMMVAVLASEDGPSVQLSISGEQWWWRVTYIASDGRRVESANEIRIPVGQSVRVELTSTDVIHSLWIPKLAGKLDMIPGRKTVLNLVATTPGVSRGQCAEYCGGAHALMSLYVVALPPEEFESWLANEQQPARDVSDPNSLAGRMLFLSHGCSGCHTIRGTAAVGTIGPDLTHLGGRMSLAAAALPNDETAIARWIVDNQHIKPTNRMPPFGIFSQSELASLSRYLSGLK